jgi:hypothetical protein
MFRRDDNLGNWTTGIKVRWWLFLVQRHENRGQYSPALEILQKVIGSSRVARGYSLGLDIA